MGAVSVQLGLLAIAKDPGRPDRAGIETATERAVAAGHRIVAQQVIADAEPAIREQLIRWIDDAQIDVVIVLGGADSEHASSALAPLVSRVLPGFTDLFRWLMFQDSGASAMLSSAEAAQCGSTFVFVLPGAIAAAMDKLILPQFDPATTPRNLVAQLPRLRAQEPSADAIPQPVVAEKTQGGSGLPVRLPAVPAAHRARALTGANVIVRPRSVEDPPTKPIDLERLERQIAISHAADQSAVTRPTDLAKLLPRVPPGADDDTATDTLAAPPAPAPASISVPSVIRPVSSRGTTPPPERTWPPSGSTPIARGPAPTPARPQPAGRGDAARTRTPSAPVPHVTIHPRKRPTSGVPVVAAARPETAVPPRAAVPTPPIPVAAITPARATPRPPTQPPPTARATPRPPTQPPPTARAMPRPPTQPPPAAALAPSPRPPTQPPPTAALAPSPIEAEIAEVSPEIATELANDPELANDLELAPPRSRPRTEPPPVPADVRVRPPTRPPPRPPTTPPPPRAADSGLPRGTFAYPVQPRRVPTWLKLLALASVAVLGFLAVVVFFGSDDRATSPATAAVPTPVSAPPGSSAPVTEPATEPAASVEPATASVITPGVEPAPVPPAPRAPAAVVRAVPPSKPGRPEPAEKPVTVPTQTAVVATPPPVAPPTSSAAADGDCDETACVLASYDRPCCAKYRPATSDFKPRIGGVPEALDRTMVRAGVGTVKPRVVACGEKAGGKGTVKVALTVAASGAVTAASLVEAPSPELGACVVDAMRSAKFGVSVNGSSFTYPFVF